MDEERVLALCGDVPWCGLPAGHDIDGLYKEYGAAHRVTADGVYNIPADLYHADPTLHGSLSSTGAKRLLPPSCPAKYAYERENGRANTDVFDFGRAAHALVLGEGPGTVVIEADDWRTKSARADRDAAYAAGQTPMLAKDYAVVETMADALRKHDTAMALFSEGRPEQAMFWTDPDTGVMCRTMLDWLPNPRPSGRLITADYKTCASAAPEALRKSMWNFGQHRQADWALSGIEALGLAEPGVARFVFVCQEKDPPYLVTIFEPDPTALLIGQWANRRALTVYADCTRMGRWPDHAAYDTYNRTGQWPDDDDVLALALPPWAERDQLQEMDD